MANTLSGAGEIIDNIIPTLTGGDTIDETTLRAALRMIMQRPPGDTTPESDAEFDALLEKKVVECKALMEASAATRTQLETYNEHRLTKVWLPTNGKGVNLFVFGVDKHFRNLAGLQQPIHTLAEFVCATSVEYNVNVLGEDASTICAQWKAGMGLGSDGHILYVLVASDAVTAAQCALDKTTPADNLYVLEIRPGLAEVKLRELVVSFMGLWKEYTSIVGYTGAAEFMPYGAGITARIPKTAAAAFIPSACPFLEIGEEKESEEMVTLRVKTEIDDYAHCCGIVAVFRGFHCGQFMQYIVSRSYAGLEALNLADDDDDDEDSDSGSDEGCAAGASMP